MKSSLVVGNFPMESSLVKFIEHKLIAFDKAGKFSIRTITFQWRLSIARRNSAGVLASNSPFKVSLGSYQADLPLSIRHFAIKLINFRLPYTIECQISDEISNEIGE